MAREYIIDRYEIIKIRGNPLHQRIRRRKAPAIRVGVGIIWYRLAFELYGEWDGFFIGWKASCR